MKKITFARVPENRIDEYLDKFFSTSTFTFEGLDITDKKSNKQLERMIHDAGYKNDEIVCFWFTGKEMNEKYNLTDNNAYKDDITLVAIPDFYNPMFKLLVNARWFDDIVQNNAYRQNEINKAKEVA